ncbi:MAG: peptidylprolyl isomerase [Caldicoprobacterales bacterium]
MNNRKGIKFLILILVLAAIMSGCVQVNEEKDRSLVIAEVNGEQIKKGEILDQYHRGYGEPEEYDEEIMLNILNSLIENKLVKQKAASAGYIVDEDVRKRAQEDYDQTIRTYGETLRQQAGEDADPDTDYEQKAREELKKIITESGQTEEGYLNLLAENIAILDFLDELLTDLKVEDNEIEEYYQEELEFQRDYPSMAAYYSSVKIVTEPASRLVKHILIKLADEDTQGIDALRKEGKEEDADALREEKLKTIESNAKKVLDRANAEEDFEALIDLFGEDPGMELEEYKDGYSMLRDESMMPEFLEASFQLQEGEISDLVPTDYGYHIIKVYKATEDIIAPLEDVKEEIRSVLLNQKKSRKTGELIDQWLEEADIKRYEKRL